MEDTLANLTTTAAMVAFLFADTRNTLMIDARAAFAELGNLINQTACESWLAILLIYFVTPALLEPFALRV